MRLTLEIVGKTLFDAEVGSDAGAVGDAITEVMENTIKTLQLHPAGAAEGAHAAQPAQPPGAGQARRDHLPPHRRPPRLAGRSRRRAQHPARRARRGRHVDDRPAGPRRGDDAVPRRPRDHGERARVGHLPAREAPLRTRPRRAGDRAPGRAQGARRLRGPEVAAVHDGHPQGDDAAVPAGLRHGAQGCRGRGRHGRRREHPHREEHEPAHQRAGHSPPARAVPGPRPLRSRAVPGGPGEAAAEVRRTCRSATGRACASATTSL